MCYKKTCSGRGYFTELVIRMEYINIQQHVGGCIMFVIVIVLGINCITFLFEYLWSVVECVLSSQKISTTCQVVYVGLEGTRGPKLRTMPLCNSKMLRKMTCSLSPSVLTPIPGFSRGGQFISVCPIILLLSSSVPDCSSKTSAN